MRAIRSILAAAVLVIAASPAAAFYFGSDPDPKCTLAAGTEQISIAGSITRTCGPMTQASLASVIDATGTDDCSDIPAAAGGGTQTLFLQWDDSLGAAGEWKCVSTNIAADLALSNAITANTHTGILTGGEVTVNVDPTKFDVAAGTGVSVNWTDPANPVRTNVSWVQQIGVTPAGLTTELFTTIAIDESGLLIQRAGLQLTPQQRRNCIELQAVVHANFTTIDSITENSIPAYEVTKSIIDYIDAIGPINGGNGYAANGVNLQVDKVAGVTTFPFINRGTDAQDPTNRTDPAETAITGMVFNYQDGVGGVTTVPLQSVVDPLFFDDGSGTLASVPNNKWSIQRFFYFSQTRATLVAYGQDTYANVTDARNGIFTEAFIGNPLLVNGTFTSALLVKKEATDLSNLSVAEFVDITESFTSSGSFAPNADPGVDHSAYVAGHADGSNCSAGSYPLGVDAAGAVEDCTDASIDTDSIVATHTAITAAHHGIGADTQVLFNDGGDPAGDPGFLFNKTTDTLTVGELVTADTDGTNAVVLFSNVAPDYDCVSAGAVGPGEVGLLARLGDNKLWTCDDTGALHEQVQLGLAADDARIDISHGASPLPSHGLLIQDNGATGTDRAIIVGTVAAQLFALGYDGSAHWNDDTYSFGVDGIVNLARIVAVDSSGNQHFRLRLNNTSGAVGVDLLGDTEFAQRLAAGGFKTRLAFMQSGPMEFHPNTDGTGSVDYKFFDDTNTWGQTLTPGTMTADRAFTLKDKSGTLSYDDDLTTECHSMHIKDPDDSDDFYLGVLPYEWTLTSLECITRGTSTPVITADVVECNSFGAGCATANLIAICDDDYEGDTTTHVVNPGNSVQVRMGSASGTITDVSVTLCGTRELIE